MTVLAVGSHHNLEQLRRIFRHTRWSLLEASTLSDAVVSLDLNSAVVLLCETVLPDGTWKAMIEHIRQLNVPPPLIVTARHADDYLWMDVLKRGGYNVLDDPFDEKEVFRLVSLAWRFRLDRVRQSGLRAAAP